MQSTRRRILTLLKKRGRLTVKELSEALEITPMGVRQHLATLEKDGLIIVGQVRTGRGRPSQIYELTNEGDELFPRTYGALAVEILGDLADTDGPEKVDELFERRRDHMRPSYEARLANKNRREQIAELAQIRDEEGYVADWEENEDGSFVLIEHNCPLRDVARDFRHACRHEMALFREVLGTENITRDHCIVEGQVKCRYLIRWPEEE